MNTLEARRLARIGEFYLHEAILGLLENSPNGMLLGKITDGLVLSSDHYQAFTMHLLRCLESVGKVHQPRGIRTEWTLTDTERKHRIPDSTFLTDQLYLPTQTDQPGHLSPK